MKIINLSQKKFKNLKTIDLGKEVTNTEANMYEFEFRSKKRIFKNLHRLKGSIFANKLLTIEMLNEYSDVLPSSFVVPKYLGSVNGEIMGCIEDYIEGENLAVVLNDCKVDVKKKLYYLKQIGALLEQLKYIRKDSTLNTIYINDLHAGNFIVTPGNDLKVVDLDSVRICDNKPFPSKYLIPSGLLRYSTDPRKYIYFDKGESSGNEAYDYRKELGFIEPNENSDIYCYIITILSYLYQDNVNSMDMDSFYNYLNYLSSIGFDKELLDSFEKIIINGDNVNPYELLNTITYDQVGRSKKIVYNLNK